jgi:hypothetical protein
MFDELVNQRIKGAGTKLVPFIDTFDPAPFVPCDRVRVAGREVIPALLSALAENNLSVFVGHDLNIIADVCRRSGGEMRLIQSADPRFHPHVTPADSNITVLARNGELLGCVASRLIWCEDTIAAEMESGRFWVADPATMWSPDERCITNAMSASIRACHVVYCGSVYLDPSIRGGHTLAALIRLHLLWLVCHWRWSWLIGLVRGDLIHHHAFDIYGAHTLQQALWRDRDGDGELHRYQLAVSERALCMDAWLRPEMGELDRPLGLPPRSVMPHEAPMPALRRQRAAAPAPAPAMARASGM